MNINKILIDTALVDYEIGRGEYLKLLSASVGAVVTIKPRGSNNAAIPFLIGNEIRSQKTIDRWFVSCNAVGGGSIEIMSSSNGDLITLNTAV